MHAEHPATLRPDQAHALLGVNQISRRAFYAAINRGQIPHIRLGRRILILRRKFLEMAGLEQPRAGGGGE